MSVKRIIYLILAILGLVLPWYYNLQFFSNAGLLDFVNESSALPYLVCQIIGFLMPYTLAGWDFKALAPLPQVTIGEAKGINNLKALPRACWIIDRKSITRAIDIWKLD